MPNLELVIIQEEVGLTPLEPIEINEVHRTISDADGFFTMDLLLDKRSKFEYFVKLDDNTRDFKPHEWQDGKYNKVIMERKIKVGEVNDCSLFVIPNGFVKARVQNLSNSKEIFVKGIYRNDLYEGVFINSLIGDSFVDDRASARISGNVEVTWEVSHGNQLDTIKQSYYVPHGEEIMFELKYE